jgi:chemotaxis protein histidine kinase CheA/ActR/RegA family two-component response regulator
MPTAANESATLPPVGSTAIAQVAAEELSMVGEALIELNTECVPQLLATEDDGDLTNALMEFEEHVSNLLNAATHIGLSGFEKVLQNLLVNTALLQISPELATLRVRHCLKQAVALSMAYVQAPSVLQSATDLALHMADTAWLHSTDVEVAQAWVNELIAVQIVTQRASESEHLDATAQDVDLSIPSDIESNVLNSLLDELPLHAQNFSQAIQRLEHGGTLADLEEARRIAHTLKGAGNTAGIKGIGNLTHVIEEVLLAFGRANQLPTPAVQASLMEAADCLEEMGESLTGGAAPPKEAVAVYQQMIDWVKSIEADGIDALPAQTSYVHAPDNSAATDTPVTQLVATDAPADIPEGVPNVAAPEEEAYLRVPVSLIESLLKLVDEDAIIAAQMQERVLRLNNEVVAQRATARQFRQLSSELEQLVDVRGLAMMGGSSHGLDSLEMDKYNELHILTRKIVEAGADGREFVQTIDGDINGLRDLVADKERVLTKIQTGIQRTRMVSVTSIVPRLQRAVRQAARVLDRDVQLRIEGEATLVDTQLLNAILDSLMHLLRNAVDHGIEPAQERSAAGKSATGLIVLSFASIGSNIAITCGDDGRGFDLAGILSKAVRTGLVAPDAVLSPEQTMRLILRPGFSTREEATHISGRGLGMSIVHNAVLQLRGTLELRSPEGMGSVFDMRFPVQLSAKQVMLSRSSQHRMALSEHGLEQLLPVDASLIEQTEVGQTYLFGEERLPVRRLDAMLGLPMHALRDTGEQEIIMVVANDQRELTAVIGPELSESRRVIVKPLGEFIPATLGVDGLSILGDGTVTTVIDLPDLLRAYENEGAPMIALGNAMPAVALPLCMVVDDSVSVRRTMEHLMQDAGYQVITARDGLDALAMLERYTPDVALVDLEMPRMNGLDLAKSMRNRPQTKTTPVVMITSRFTDRHRALALEAGVNEFLTKPYTEEVLLGVVDALLRTQTKRNTG